MYLNSLFKDRAYVLPLKTDLSKSEIKFINKILKNFDDNINIQKIKLVEVNENYDIYKIISDNEVLMLKFSFDVKNKTFNREIKNLKKEPFNNSSICPKFLYGGRVNVGENILCSITSFPNGDRVYDLGASEFRKRFSNFLSFYKKIHLYKEIRSCNLTYERIKKEKLNELNLGKILDEDGVKFIENHSDYSRCALIFDSIDKEIKSLLKQTKQHQSGYVINEVRDKSIYIDNASVCFCNLGDVSLGHAFSDLASFIVEFNVDENLEKEFLKKACDELDIEFNQQVYNLYYGIELRLKALTCFISYLKEVYLYESLRIDEILNLINKFSLSYKRFCSIPTFKKHRDFIMKNITEPVLELDPKKEDV